MIGRDFVVDGNGTVTIGDNCDIGPEVSFQTGGHIIGDSNRRAGVGRIHHITVGNGTWICAKCTVANSIVIGNSSVVAACSFVNKDVKTIVLLAEYLLDILGNYYEYLFFFKK